MVVVCEGMQVVGMSMREGENSRGKWEMYELECANGKGKTATLQCDKAIFEEVAPFEEITAEIELKNRGYNLDGQVIQIWK